MTGRAAALRTEVEAALPVLLRAMRRMWQTSDLAARYAEYLCAMHAVVRASVPLLAAAAGRCAQLGAGDPVAGPLAAYLGAHAAEERDHDQWLRADLAAIGRDADEPLRRIPPPAVAVLVGAQYYWVLHHHPACLLGYITVLEGQPPPAALPERLAELTGLPLAGFRTLRAHARLDPGHRDRLERLLDLLPLTPSQETAVALSARHTIGAAARLFQDLAEGAWR